MQLQCIHIYSAFTYTDIQCVHTHTYTALYIHIHTFAQTQMSIYMFVLFVLCTFHIILLHGFYYIVLLLLPLYCLLSVVTM